LEFEASRLSSKYAPLTHLGEVNSFVIMGCEDSNVLIVCLSELLTHGRLHLE